MRRTCVLIACVLALAACTDRFPMQPDHDARFGATATTERPGFAFLAPLAHLAGSVTGTLDSSLPVSVDICAAGTACEAADGVAAFGTGEGAGPDRIRVDDDGQAYIVNWDTRGDAVRAGRTYSIRVRVGDAVLGSVDVHVVANASELRTLRPGAYGIVKNQTLPIRFRIEQGVITAAVIGTEGGVLESSDGGVLLGFPPGALATGTLITAEPLATVPDPDGRVVPGSAFRFGPSGTRFAEPVYLAIASDPAGLPAGVTPGLLRVHRLVDGAWELLPDGGVDMEQRVVWTTTEHFSTYALLPLSLERAVAGEHFACGIDSDSRAWCWGANNAGQLGNGTTTSSAVAVPVGGGTPYQVWRCTPRLLGPSSCSYRTELRPHQFRSLTLGSQHACAISNVDGRAYCWGANVMGQLGRVTSTPMSTTPIEASGGREYTTVAAGYQQTCARTSSGELYCWGSNHRGALGTATSETCGPASHACSRTPLLVPTPEAFQQISTGLLFACGNGSGGTYCWGWNGLGQLGTGRYSTSEPITLMTGSPYGMIDAGAAGACGLKNGVAYCWGDNSGTGVIGDGTRENRLTPTLVAGNLRFGQISVSKANYLYSHTCALTGAGEVYCWGANRDGGLGVTRGPDECSIAFGGGHLEEFDCALAPNRVPSPVAFRHVSTGWGMTCAGARDGGIYCWGANDRGQLGNGTTVPSRTPVRVLTQ